MEARKLERGEVEGSRRSCLLYAPSNAQHYIRGLEEYFRTWLLLGALTTMLIWDQTRIRRTPSLRLHYQQKQSEIE